MIYHDITQYSYLEAVFSWQLLGCEKCKDENNNSKYLLLIQISDYEDNWRYQFILEVECSKNPNIDIIQQDDQQIPEECFEFLRKICEEWNEYRIFPISNKQIGEYLNTIDCDRKHCFTYECFTAIISLYYDYIAFNNMKNSCENCKGVCESNFFSVYKF